MDDDQITGFNPSERVIATVVLVGLTIALGFDLAEDFESGSPLRHILWEGGIVLTAACVASWLIARYLLAKRLVRQMRNALKSANADTEKAKMEEELWRTRSSKMAQGLSQAIRDQFQRWEFSPAEIEVALLLLKGLPLKTIATMRQVTEHTIRQQALAIYQKSGLAGRAELSAFFLGELLGKIEPSP